MSQQSSQPVDVPEVDDAISEDIPLTQRATTTATSSRGRGRGRWSRANKGKVTKPVQPKAPPGRGRRQKVYASAKAQAAHERAQELKQAFSAVVRSVKPAVQEIADRSINELLEDPTAYQKVPEYDIAQSFLRGRLDDALKQCELRLETAMAMAEHVYNAERELVNRSYTVSPLQYQARRRQRLHRPLSEECPTLTDSRRIESPSCVKTDTASFFNKSPCSNISTITICPLM